MVHSSQWTSKIIPPSNGMLSIRLSSLDFFLESLLFFKLFTVTKFVPYVPPKARQTLGRIDHFTIDNILMFGNEEFRSYVSIKFCI
jgi:hypothetical protein